MELSHYCFDMDGTLVDSSKTIYNSTVITLDRLGIEHNLNEIEFSLKIGQHFQDIFEAFNINVPDFEKYITEYKKIYLQQMEHSSLYPEVEEVLGYLKNKNVLISLLTTKAQDQTEKILDYFNLSAYFNYVMGRREGIPHKPSPEPLVIICNELDVRVESSLMIGDTELDIRCGKAAGSLTCAVEYGYRSKELLEVEQPDFLINRLSEVLKI